MDIRPHKEIKESRAVDFWEKKKKEKKKIMNVLEEIFESG